MLVTCITSVFRRIINYLVCLEFEWGSINFVPKAHFSRVFFRDTRGIWKVLSMFFFISVTDLQTLSCLVSV